MSGGAGDGALAWRVLRQVDGYVEAWDRHAARARARALEPGPFRILVQADCDIEAARFELLAWEDPSGPGPPFWLQDGMTEALLKPDAMPLAAIPGEGGTVEGLRLLSGDLVVRIGAGAASVQVRVRDAPRVPDDGGLSVLHDFGLRMPRSMRRMNDFWSAAGVTSPRSGRVRRETASGRTGSWPRCRA